MAEEAPVHDDSVLLDRSEAMATLTLGQMLDVALGSSKAGAIDFEQLHNLLNGMLLHLGLRDLAVQENGEPLEGSDRSLFSAAFLEELKQKVEANENEIAEVRALCQELREEVSEMKVEQSRMVEDMQKMQEDFGMNMEDLRNQLLAAVMDMMQSKKGSRDLDALSGHSRPYDDEELIVIGNEITLLERPISRVLGDTRPVTPLPPKAKAQGRGKGLMEANASGHPVSFEANDMGQNVGQKDTRSNTGRSDMGRKGTGRNVAQNDMGQNDVGQDDISWNMGQKNMRQNVQLSDTGQNDMEQNDVGQNDMGQIKDEEIKKSMAKAETLPSDLDVLPEMIDAGEIKTSISEVEALPSPLDGPPEMANMGEIKDEEMKMRISKVKALPSPLDGSPEMASMGEIKDEEMKMRISKAPPDVQKKSLDGGFTASRIHPGAPVQWVQPVQGHPGSQNLWIPDKSVPGTSRHSQITPSTPPPSPGFSGHLPRAFKRHPCVPVQQHREPPATGYSRRSPLYCGGKHTTTYPVQPMEPLLPDPNKPGVCDLMGKDGLLYRGRTR